MVRSGACVWNRLFSLLGSRKPWQNGDGTAGIALLSSRLSLACGNGFRYGRLLVTTVSCKQQGSVLSRILSGHEALPGCQGEDSTGRVRALAMLSQTSAGVCPVLVAALMQMESGALYFFFNTSVLLSCLCHQEASCAGGGQSCSGNFVVVLATYVIQLGTS